jgi:hypothetical protein
MTTTAIDNVGFCAHYSSQGDWAFDFALALARRHRRQLNIFHFLSDPYAAVYQGLDRLSPAAREQILIDRERDLRFYYEERLGDYVEAGFRICEDEEWTELHRCLCKREFQVLVLGVPGDDAVFGGKPIGDFARSFVCPVVLVGPGRPEEIGLNAPAVLLEDALGLEPGSWRRLSRIAGLESA